MIDSGTEAFLIECDWLLPNALELGGPVEAIYHIYERNSLGLQLIQQSIGRAAELRKTEEPLCQFYLHRHGAEFIKILIEAISPCIEPTEDKLAALRVIRHSRRYLPPALAALGQVLDAAVTNALSPQQILFDRWICPQLETSFPQHKPFLNSLFDYSDSQVRKYDERLILRFLRGRCEMERTGQTLSRTDSFTQRRHVSVRSSRDQSLSPESLSTSLSHSKTPSPVFTSLPSSLTVECCQQHNLHPLVIAHWVGKKRDRLKPYKESNEKLQKDIVQLAGKRSNSRSTSRSGSLNFEELLTARKSAEKSDRPLLSNLVTLIEV